MLVEVLTVFGKASVTLSNPCYCNPIILSHRRENVSDSTTVVTWKVGISKIHQFGKQLCFYKCEILESAHECCLIFQTRFTKIVFMIYGCFYRKLASSIEMVFLKYHVKIHRQNCFRNLNVHIYIRNLIVVHKQHKHSK